MDKGIEELYKDNEQLKKPLDFENVDDLREEIKDVQKELEESTKQDDAIEHAGSEKMENKNASVSDKMKSSGTKMKELSEKLQQQAAGAMGGSGVAEDAEMLRQILDNLVLFH